MAAVTSCENTLYSLRGRHPGSGGLLYERGGDGRRLA